MRKERARRMKRGPKMLIGKGRNVAYKSMRLRKWKDEGTKEKKCHKYRKKKKGGAVNVIYRRKKMKEKNRRRDKRRDRRREEEERKERGRREEGERKEGRSYLWWDHTDGTLRIQQTREAQAMLIGTWKERR